MSVHINVQSMVDAAKRAFDRIAGHTARELLTSEGVTDVERSLPTRDTAAAPAEVVERADETVLRLDVPGANRRTTDVTVDGHHLTVLARRADTADPDVLDWHRCFELSDEIDSHGISADLRAGVLTVRLPKRPAARSRRVPIGRGGLPR